jgi:hypothetical protein
MEELARRDASVDDASAVPTVSDVARLFEAFQEFGTTWGESAQGLPGTAGRWHGGRMARSIRPVDDSPYQRAEALLLAHLTPEQRQSWREHKYVKVSVQEPGYAGTYWIWGHGKTDRIDTEDTLTHRYCLQSKDSWVPDDDRVLAEVLLLTYAPATYHATANVLYDAAEVRRWETGGINLSVSLGTAVADAIDALTAFGAMVATAFTDFADAIRPPRFELPSTPPLRDTGSLRPAWWTPRQDTTRGRDPPRTVIRVDSSLSEERLQRLEELVRRALE